MQHTATHCNTLQHTATHCNTLQKKCIQCVRRVEYKQYTLLQCVAVCCSVLQCVAVCCSVLQCVSCDEYKQYTQHGITTVYTTRHHTRRVKCRIIHTIFVLLRQTLGLLCIHYTASHNDSDAVLYCHFFDFVVSTTRHHAKGLLLYRIIQMVLLHIQYGIT